MTDRAKAIRAALLAISDDEIKKGLNFTLIARRLDKANFNLYWLTGHKLNRIVAEDLQATDTDKNNGFSMLTGQYRSDTATIALNLAARDKEDPNEVFLHELGHHMAFTQVVDANSKTTVTTYPVDWIVAHSLLTGGASEFYQAHRFNRIVDASRALSKMTNIPIPPEYRGHVGFTFYGLSSLSEWIADAVRCYLLPKRDQRRKRLFLWFGDTVALVEAMLTGKIVNMAGDTEGLPADGFENEAEIVAFFKRKTGVDWAVKDGELTPLLVAA